MNYKQIIILVTMIVSPIALAGSLDIPNKFDTGSAAKSSEVNSNFTAIEISVDDNDSRITENTKKISSNDSDINLNTSGITLNADNIISNSTDISDLQDRAWGKSGDNLYYDTGNVGIGTTTPNEKLSVIGTIESTIGGIKFPDGTIQTTAAPASNNSNAQSMVGGFPDAIVCNGEVTLLRMKTFKSDSEPNSVTYVSLAPDGGNPFQDGRLIYSTTIAFFEDGTYMSHFGASQQGWLCANGGDIAGKTIAELYSEGKAFNLAGNSVWKVSSNGINYTTGNVGVGTANPQAKLDIAGNIKFNGQKACSPFLSGNWRDTILVPASWSASTCEAYADAQSAEPMGFNLYCIFEDGFSVGSGKNGGVPEPNCGW